MKFVVGFIGGVVVGAAGAVAYSVRSGRDLREAFEEVRTDINKRDFDALGARLEAGVAEIQAMLETRMKEVRERSGVVGDETVAVNDPNPVGDAIDAANGPEEAAEPDASVEAPEAQ
jgi:hypothetical protein